MYSGVGSPQVPAWVTPAVPTANAIFVELITRAVAAAMAPVELEAMHTEIIAMKNVDETCGRISAIGLNTTLQYRMTVR